MAKTNWKYVNIPVSSFSRLRALAEKDGYIKPPALMQRLIDEEWERQGLTEHGVTKGESHGTHG